MFHVWSWKDNSVKYNGFVTFNKWLTSTRNCFHSCHVVLHKDIFLNKELQKTGLHAIIQGFLRFVSLSMHQIGIILGIFLLFPLLMPPWSFLQTQVATRWPSLGKIKVKSSLFTSTSRHSAHCNTQWLWYNQPFIDSFSVLIQWRPPKKPTSLETGQTLFSSIAERESWKYRHWNSILFQTHASYW